MTGDMSAIIDYPALTLEQRAELDAKRKAQEERLLVCLAEYYVSMTPERKAKWWRSWRTTRSQRWLDEMRKRIAEVKR